MTSHRDLQEQKRFVNLFILLVSNGYLQRHRLQLQK